MCAAYLAQAVSCLSVCSYPYNLDFDYGPLEGLQKYCINNLGAQRVPGAADADVAQLVFVPLAAAAAACNTVPACKWAKGMLVPACKWAKGMPVPRPAGDPFIESNYGVHSREFEIGVLQVGSSLSLFLSCCLGTHTLWQLEQLDGCQLGTCCSMLERSKVASCLSSRQLWLGCCAAALNGWPAAERCQPIARLPCRAVVCAAVGD